MTKKSNVEKIRTIRAKKVKAKNPPKRKNVSQNTSLEQKPEHPNKKEFPSEFPFWARFKKNKNRTTLVIDEEIALNKKTKKLEDMFVHRESTHTYKKEYQKIFPNPDIDDHDPMYLKRPKKHPKRMFGVHNKKLNMPDFLKEKYRKNNKKNK